jgi:hypothetical protein
VRKVVSNKQINNEKVLLRDYSLFISEDGESGGHYERNKIYFCECGHGYLDHFMYNRDNYDMNCSLCNCLDITHTHEVSEFEACVYEARRLKEDA